MRLPWQPGDAGLIAQVIVHADPDCPATCHDWKSMLETNNLTVAMGGRGSCDDSACAERFFALLTRERIRRKIYRTHEEGRADVFNDIGLLNSLIRRHGNNRMYRQWNMKKLYFETIRCLAN